jgi:hypothetical protein
MIRPMIRLSGVVGESHNTTENDVWELKKGLGELGYYRPHPASGWHSYPDHELLEAIRAFQGDEALTVDGVVAPDGPTLARVNAQLERKRRREARRQATREAEKAAAERAEREARIPSTNELRDSATQARRREEIAKYLDLAERRGSVDFLLEAVRRDLDRHPAIAIRNFETLRGLNRNNR